MRDDACATAERAFSVVVMTREEPAVIQAFVQHYRRAGAAQVMVFHDGQPEAELALPDEGTELVVCDASFWSAGFGARPDVLEERQEAIYAHALNQCRTGWLLVVDSDELLCSDRPVAEVLDLVPGDVDVVRVPNVEAVWSAGDDPEEDFGAHCFRRTVRSRMARLVLLPVFGMVYGRDLALLGGGVVGHASGKQFLRAGRSYARIGLHTSLHADRRPGRWIGEFAKDRIFIAHFDAISFHQWRRKFVRRRAMRGTVARMRPRREKLVELIGATADQSEAGLRALFRRLYQLSPLQFAILRLFDLAFTRDIRQ